MSKHLGDRKQQPAPFAEQQRSISAATNDCFDHSDAAELTTALATIRRLASSDSGGSVAIAFASGSAGELALASRREEHRGGVRCSLA